MKKTKLFIFGILLQSSISHGQYWNTNGLNSGGAGNTFGTFNNFPINVFTNNVNMARFTSSLALTTPWDNKRNCTHNSGFQKPKTTTHLLNCCFLDD